jgi:hypothetical protein
LAWYPNPHARTDGWVLRGSGPCRRSAPNSKKQQGTRSEPPMVADGALRVIAEAADVRCSHPRSRVTPAPQAAGAFSCARGARTSARLRAPEADTPSPPFSGGHTGVVASRRRPLPPGAGIAMLAWRSRIASKDPALVLRRGAANILHGKRPAKVWKTTVAASIDARHSIKVFGNAGVLPFSFIWRTAFPAQAAAC